MTDETTPPPPPTPDPSPRAAPSNRSFQGPSHPADDQPVSPIAARVGPPVVLISLVLTAALIAWMAIAPTAVEGPIDEAPFAVPATLVVPPDDDGCLTIVDGLGGGTERCLDVAVSRDDEEEGYIYVETYFDEEGRLLVGPYPQLSIIDLDTGESLGTIDVEERFGEEGPPLPGRASEPERQVYPREDRVYVIDDPDTHFGDPADDELLLDLEGPWGFQVTDAVLSPDGAWLLLRTNRSQIVVAPVDGSTPPYEWTVVPGDRWVDLRSHVRWDD